jgi:hypothetical protein
VRQVALVEIGVDALRDVISPSLVAMSPSVAMAGAIAALSLTAGMSWRKLPFRLQPICHEAREFADM